MSMPNLPTGKVSHSAFLGVQWTMTALSACFIVFRVSVKLKWFHKLMLDDYLVVAAWCMFLSTSVIWTLKSPALYEQYDILKGIKTPDAGYVARYTDFLRTILPLTVLFYSCLWTVKLSFLAFFWKLGNKVTVHRIWCYIVGFITLGTYIACIADIDYDCFLKDFTWIAATCISRSKIAFQNRTFYANCAADVITDMLILSIPIALLWDVKIPLKKKLLLFAIFSITVVIMVIAIIRVAVVNSNDSPADISWLYLWSSIEVGVSIIISCMASFRQLFTSSQPGRTTDRSKSSSNISGPFMRLISKGTQKNTHGSTDHSRTNRSLFTNKRAANSLDGSQSETNILPLKNIHVRESFELHHGPGHTGNVQRQQEYTKNVPSSYV